MSKAVHSSILCMFTFVVLCSEELIPSIHAQDCSLRFPSIWECRFFLSAAFYQGFCTNVTNNQRTKKLQQTSTNALALPDLKCMWFLQQKWGRWLSNFVIPWDIQVHPPYSQIPYLWFQLSTDHHRSILTLVC